MNFKGVQTFWEKYDKFSKILSWLDLHKSDLVGHTDMQEFELQHKCQMTWFE
jgi:hypothetical protein